jgi:hypothetical protein
MSFVGDAEERFSPSRPIGKTKVWAVGYRFFLDQDRSERGAPSILECRFAVLPFAQGGAVVAGTGDGAAPTSYAVYDRWLSRVVDGMYFHAEDALRVAGALNRDKHVGISEPPVVHLLYPDMKSGETPWRYWLGERAGIAERDADVDERDV